MSAPLRCLATTTPGLEPLLAGEVSRLGADAVLTDHGSEAWYRNLQFRPLEAPNGKSKSVAITEQHGN